MEKKMKTRLNVGERRRKIVAFVLLTLISVLCILPLLWAFGTSFKKNALTDIMSIIPKEFSFDNYIKLFSDKNSPVLLWLLNSLMISGVHTVLYLIVAALAGYAFGVAEWRGRNVVFGFLLGTAMVPSIINLVPLYNLITNMNLNGNVLALILPGLGGVLYMMLIRQYFMSVPKELIEAAQLEGLGQFGIFLRIIVPLCKSAFMVAAMMTFIGSWNDYLWPSIAMAGVESKYLTLPLGIAKLLGDNNIQYGMTMAGAITSMLPTLIVYLFLQNKIIDSVANSGSKS
ncbi:MAG: carbohydrate ABC transporter permease [Clostridia bacterium]|nr:carbohydrate ABC transporter permease [Clostridia bacterium]